MTTKNQSKYPELDDYCFCPEMIDWVKGHIEKYATILEFGSGVGSNLLAQDYDMFCVENNPDWYNKFSSINYISAQSAEHSRGYKWGRLWDKVQLHVSRPISLLIIDGPSGIIGRHNWVDQAKRMDIKYLSCPVIIDDTHRKVEQSIVQAFKERMDHPAVKTVQSESSPKKFTVLIP